MGSQRAIHDLATEQQQQQRALWNWEILHHVTKVPNSLLGKGGMLNHWCGWFSKVIFPSFVWVKCYLQEWWLESWGLGCWTDGFSSRWCHWIEGCWRSKWSFIVKLRHQRTCLFMLWNIAQSNTERTNTQSEGTWHSAELTWGNPHQPK